MHVFFFRYIAVIHPLKANSAFSRRGYIMLGTAWAFAAMCSVPQVLKLHLVDIAQSALKHIRSKQTIRQIK